MKIDHAVSLVRQMGVPWLVYRVGYAVRRRAGLVERKTPRRAWSDYALERVAADGARERLVDELRANRWGAGLRDEGSSPRSAFAREGEEAAREIDAAREGRYAYFSGPEREGEWPPAWHRHPETGDEWPRDHWSRLEDLGASDVKWLWEPARFALAYAATRAWRATGGDADAEAFWQLVESWRDENPPNAGAHWMCGQEASIRVLAWTFALFALLDARATTALRAATLVEMLAAHAERIDANIDFALSQKNNHAVNEALGLFAIGTLFPFLRGASGWEAKGRRLLEREARRQIYDDGAYVQHSLNYHRLVLQSFAWALRLAETGGQPLSEALRERVGRSARFLYLLTDESGRAPNYGANDGATLFRLDGCEFEDYRPALALAFWATERRRVFEPGPWDEPLGWLYGDEPLEAEVRPLAREPLSAADGGYYTIRGDETWGFTRSAVYRDRPAQADMLHADLWWRGANVVADPGTYSYNSPPPWNNGLAATAAHNTIAVDGLDQMERGARFTWFHWTRARVVREAVLGDGRVRLFEGEHDGYLARAGAVHRRAILLVAERVWIVVDDVTGSGEHELSSAWLFPGSSVVEHADGFARLESSSGELGVWFRSFGDGDAGRPSPIEAVEGDEATTRGWISTRYLQKRPALSIVVAERLKLPARRVTVFGLGEGVDVGKVETDRVVLTVDGEREEIALRPISSRGAASIVV